MKIKYNRQSVLEFAEHVAKSREARLSQHSAAFLFYQTTISYFVEDAGSFNRLPAAFGSRDALITWARTNNQDVKTIRHDIPESEVILTLGSNSGPPYLSGQELLWAKATSGHYREAVLEWVYKITPSGLQNLHAEAAQTANDISKALQQQDIRKKISKTRRQKLSGEFHDLAQRLWDASKCPKRAKDEAFLLEYLNSSLDADHVVNRKSLRNLPDAWVMIVPVIAGTNRAFGRLIEKLAPPFPKGTQVIPLDAITALKLFAAKISKDEVELKDQFAKYRAKMIRQPLSLAQELDEAEATLFELIRGTKKQFIRQTTSA